MKYLYIIVFLCKDGKTRQKIGVVADDENHANVLAIELFKEQKPRWKSIISVGLD